MTTVTWVVDNDGRHEVSSPEHLVQLMHKGGKYTDAGSPPANYLGAAVTYIQTVDIDLQNYHGDITTIGGDSAWFYATYDGGGHSIANWELHDGSNRRTYSAMFGRFDTNGTVKHLRLTGVWKNTGEAVNKGFLVAFMDKETCSVYDIKTDFERGTLLSGEYNSVLGVLVGACEGKISACVVEGFIKVRGHANNLGGIVGALDRFGSLTYCANYGNFVGGLGTHNTETTVRYTFTGGIVGRCHYGFRNMHNVVNGMIGDLSGGYVGGIISTYSHGSPPERADTWLNCMVGDIIGTYQYGFIAGMMGRVDERSGEILSLSKMVNYMKGDIKGIGPWVMRDPGGGIVGKVYNTSDTFNLSNSIIAMNGFVSETTIDSTHNEATPSNASVTVNTDFGLTFNTNTHATADPLTGFLTDDVFTLLPYLDTSGTDEFGNVVEFNPTFANLSGLDPISPYAQYATLTIHTSPVISFPMKTTFGYDETNTTKYLTYTKKGDVTIDLYVDDAVTVQSTEADAVFTQSGTLLQGVDWVQDGSGVYEISSHRHLIQLMTKGTVYSDTGSFPSDYRVGAYAQTADIDLEGYGSVIAPIGQKDDAFVGDYLGGGFAISSWGYERGTDDDGTDVRVGLFGEMQGDISQLKLRGVWYLGLSSCSQAGFLAAQVNGSTSRIFDIDADFDVGTTISPSTSTQSTCGILIGKTEGVSTGIHLSGDVTYEGKSTILGGVVGEMSDGASISWIRNDVVFNATNAGLGAGNSVTSSIADVLVGGIVGSIGAGTDSAFHLYNAMAGDIQGEFCGGIIGRCSTEAMTRSDTWVNCMQGNITGIADATNGCSGGIIGDFQATDVLPPVITKVVNYMYGDIVGAQSGGILGRTIDASGGAAPAVQCSNSVVAMNGTVTDTAIGQAGHPVALSVSVNADFGLTFTTNSYASDDALTGYVTNPDFPLPYLEMKGGELGMTNDFEIWFVNLGGVVDTSPFYGRECLTIHTSPTITFPYKTEFDLPDTNTTVYLTYGNLSSPTIFVDPSLTVLSSESPYVLDHSGILVMGEYPPVNVSVVVSLSGVNKRYHSFTAYTKELALGNRPDTWFGSSTRICEAIKLRSLTGVSFGRPSTSARGMHYNPATDNAYYVNGSNGRLQAFDLETYAIVDISTDGTYHTLQGDFSNTYMFGSKTSAGGVQQVFRTDADGTNEVVVDTSTLFGGSSYGTSGFAVDRDNQKVYFHDTTNYIVRSLSWDLTGLTNLQTLVGDLTLHGHNSGSLFYAQGFLFFGGKDPQTNKVDHKFYRYHLKDGGTSELLGVSDNMGHITLGPTNDLYIDPFHNVMTISGMSETWTVEGTDFDFYKAYCSVTSRYFDGWSVVWEPVEGAISYQVVVNDIVVGTTTDLYYTTRGHADGTFLNISIKFSSDDVTYTDAPYAYTSAPVRSTFAQTESPPNYERPRAASMAWLDPYNPSEVIYTTISGRNAIYNFSTDTSIDFHRHSVTMFRRSSTKDIIGLTTTKFYNFGENATRLVQGTIPPEFYTHPQNIQNFHCSHNGLIYFTAKTSNEVWSMKNDGTDAQLLFTLNGTASSLATDPHNPTTLVYGDGTDLMYRNLSTGVSRLVFPGAKMSYNNGIVVLDDFIYTTYRWQNEGYIRVHIDGDTTDMVQGGRSWGHGTLVDTVNKKVYEFDDTHYTVHVSASYTIASLPADPSSMVVTTTPLGLLAQWGPVEGAVQYRLGTSVGSEGEGGITIRHTTVDVLRYRHTAEPETTHTVYLYYDTSDATNVLHSSKTVQIPAASNSAEDFDKSFFESTTGSSDEYDLTTVTGDFGLVMNDLFESGDKVKMKLSSGKHLATRFVKRGENIRLAKDEVLSVPFSPDAGAGQTVSFTLSDETIVSVAYDETTEYITINGVAYTSGDTFIMDGQKVTIVDA